MSLIVYLILFGCIGQALFESGESYKQLAEIKYLMEDNIKQNFIEPLIHLQTKDLKEVNVRWLDNFWRVLGRVCAVAP